MATLTEMCSAGMLISALSDQVKKAELPGVSFDTKQYMLEKLQDTFLNVQLDISLAVASSLGQNVSDIMEEDNE